MSDRRESAMVLKVTLAIVAFVTALATSSIAAAICFAVIVWDERQEVQQ